MKCCGSLGGQSAYFYWLNRGKELICLDLTLENDRAVLDSMIARADVFIQNRKPGRVGSPPQIFVNVFRA
uniref:CoA transferase n=1 Tax=Bradyrhizobium sp. ISRA442 TaxID=2866197 RepID=UPI00311ADBAC